MSGAINKQAQSDELIGQVINDRFRILSAIARGGMGRVYRAEQVPLGRLVAIKTLDPRNNGTEGDPQFQQRFFLEASVASKLQHPNTVTVFDYGKTADGIYFIAMELVEGRSLLHAIREHKKLEPHRVLHIALQIARSLREAHRLDVIHRDLKPGNVLLTQHGDEDDFVKVLDFGLVKHVETEQQQELTQAGLFMGSPKYMSPEQIRGEHVDARCDIYALGVCMYEMLTGHVPFERENTVKILMAHMHEHVPPIQDSAVPPALSQLVMRCLSKNQQDRPASMDDVILLLKQASGGPMLLSGQFPLSQEMSLSGTISPSARIAGTPSQSFVASTHPYTPSTGFSQSMMTPGMAQQMPASMAPTGAVAPAAAPASSWVPKAAVALALVLAGGFLALRVSERDQTATAALSPSGNEAPAMTVRDAREESPEQPTAPGAVPAVAAPEAVEPAPQARRLAVRVTSTPPEAIITIDGKPYGVTPADIELWAELAEPGRELTFTLTKSGFDKFETTRTIKGPALAVDAMLARSAPVIRRPRPEHARQPEAPRAPVVIGDNFKDDPY